MPKTESLSDQMQELCLQIVQDGKRELYLSMRYLDLALEALKVQVTTQIDGFGTDGRTLAVHPHMVLDMYEQDRRRINRLFLHEVLHCLLRHLFKQPRRDRFLWDLSCDIAVWSIIDGMRYRSVRMPAGRLRMNTYQHLKEKLPVLTAEGIYRVLEGERLSQAQRERLAADFCLDDHRLWPWQDPSSPTMPMNVQMLQDFWQDIAEKAQTDMETFSRDAASGAGDLHEQVSAANHKRGDYRTFLRKFAVLKEEMGTDPDTFDYIFYTYGLSLYGNLPLIEPQEYREVRKIEEFVLVIDVSMSTSGELVHTFLEQTYAVLTEKNSYFRQVNIRILQCDEKVVSDRKITSREELDNYMKNFSLEGGGGTDFRPAFAYVEELISRGELNDLRGMIYFTDGRGIYPRRRPSWETAFVFMQEDYTDALVPPWAVKLILHRDDLEEDEKKVRTDHRFIFEEGEYGRPQT